MLLGYFLSLFLEYVLSEQAHLFMEILEDFDEEQDLISDALVEGRGIDCSKQISEEIVAIGLLVIAFVAGTAFYARVHDPPLSLVDGAYFTVVSITTVGYGDVVPDTVGLGSQPCSRPAPLLLPSFNPRYINTRSILSIQKDSGKLFSVFFLPFATVLLARVAGDIVLKMTAEKRAEILRRTRNVRVQ